MEKVGDNKERVLVDTFCMGHKGLPRTQDLEDFSSRYNQVNNNIKW